jgi:hypothetical protein
MDTRRRFLGVVTAVVLLAALPLARPAAQTQPHCDHGDEAELGPMCATLQVPNTYFTLMDVDMNRTFRIRWNDTIVSCGNFYEGAVGFDQEGKPEEDETNTSSIWGHSNGPPDNCTHDASSHPGTIVADIEVGFQFSNLRKIDIPGRWYTCKYSGSASGTGTPCTDPPPEPDCVENDDGVSVRTAGDPVAVSGEGSDVVVESGAMRCVLPITKSGLGLTILGSAGPDEITIELDDMASVFRDSNFWLGVNPESDLDSVILRWGDTNDRMVVRQLPTLPDLSGFMIDVDGNGTSDIGVAGTDPLNLDLGGGDDQATVKQLLKTLLDREPLGPLIQFDGGAGTDKAFLDVLDSGRTNLGLTEQVMRATEAHSLVNLDAGSGETVDLSWLSFEGWTVTGTGGSDTITGAGGAGTGGPFATALTILGKAGADRLTGGIKGDKLNGGPARDVCTGGKGKDSATGCETVRSIP